MCGRMRPKSKGRGRPGPAAAILKMILREVEKALCMEEKIKYDLIGALADQKPEEEDGGLASGLVDRDNVVHELRFLKVWFQLPSPVFVTAVSYIDRFLTRMKVQRKFMACVAISCLYIACELHGVAMCATELIEKSRVRCTEHDLCRMAAIIRHKVGDDGAQPITARTYLRLFMRYFDQAAAKLHIRPLFTRMLQMDSLENHLEVAILDSDCASWRPSALALVLIESEIQRFLVTEIPANTQFYTIEMLKFLGHLVDLHSLCALKADELSGCHRKLLQVLGTYESGGRIKTTSRGKYIIRRSSLLRRPSNNFQPHLGIIREI